MKSIKTSIAILALCMAFPGSAMAFLGFGVVADDVLAGVYANLAVRVATWALKRLSP